MTRSTTAGRVLVAGGLALVMVLLSGWSCGAVRADASGADPGPGAWPGPDAEVGAAGPGAATQAADRPILLTNEKLSRSVWAEVRPLGVEYAHIITQGAIDPKKTGTPDLEKVRMAARRIPESFTGYAVLDWENPVFEHLKEGPDSPRFGATIRALVEAVRAARQARPNVKWGYYGLPRREYWNRDEKWRAEARALKPLIDEVDAVFPSVYDFYRDGTDRSARGDSAYVRDNIRLALEIAGDKPVFAYVWHRYHESNREAANARIPAPELKTLVRAALSTQYQGRRAAGIVWWGAEAWQAGRGKHLDELRPGESQQQFVDRVHLETARVLAEALRGDP